MAKIYISSTFEDLKEQRLCIMRTLRDLGHVPVCMERYRASERPPLEVCLSDVASCDGYIGLLAFRYGSLAGPYNKSFTHLEYEKAIECGIPPLMFLLSGRNTGWEPDKVDREQERILAFRDQVSGKHVVGIFTDLLSLSREVKNAVRERFGEGQQGVYDQLRSLPYLCDCSEQELKLTEAIGRRRLGKPFVCIVHGDELQSHDDFLFRLQKRILPDLLGLNEIGIQGYRVPWPDRPADASEIARKLLLKLAALTLPRGRPSSQEEVQKELAAQLGPALIHTLVLTETWLQQGEEVIDRFLDFWKDWPTLEGGQVLIVTLLVQYQLKSHLSLDRREKYLSRNEEIRSRINSLEAAAASSPFDRIDLAVLPNLDGVSLLNALDWAECEDVRCFAPSSRIARDLRILF